MKMAEVMINSAGQDIDGIRLSPQEKQKREEREQQQQQQALELQKLAMQLEAQKVAMEEQAKQQARAQGQIAIDRAKSTTDLDSKTIQQSEELKNTIKQIVVEVSENLRADIVRMNEEARLERLNPNVAVGHGNDIGNDVSR